jgi:hypothetical protein
MISGARQAILLASAVLLAGCRATAIDPAFIADAQTAVRVKTALVNDPVLGESAIEVRVVGGVAQLSGRVRSQAEVERAVRMTQAVAGVASVASNLQVGGDAAPPAPTAPPEEPLPSGLQLPEPDPIPGLLLVGATVGWSIPAADSLKTRASFGPLIRFGSPRGLSPAIGFDWFQADLASFGGGETLARVRIRPVMAGLGYTLASDRVSVTPSLVAGYAFNSLTITDTGVVRGLPVEVANSLVWRVGVSAWHDVGRRTAINVSTGYVMTGLRLTVLDDARLVELDMSGDTAIVHVGVAYKLF